MAEIELLLTVMLLAILCLLTTGAMRLALARLDTAQGARVEAARRAVGQEAATDDVPVSPVPGYTTIRPGLPLRAHCPRVAQEVPIFQESSASSPDSTSRIITISSTATSISPAWPFPAEPVDGDYSANRQWFLDYFQDVHGKMSGPLQLSPAWPP